MGLVDFSRSTTERVHKLRGLLGKKRTKASEDGLTQVAEPEATSRKDPPEILSLWDRAYDVLRRNNGQLVKDYEDLLEREVQEGSLPDNLSDDSTDRQSRQLRLAAVIATGLQRIEEKKTRYTIAGREFNLSDQIDQAARLVIWAKDWIGEAVKRSPEASLVWVGVSVIFPLLTNPKVADEANRDGFTYVTTRMEYYAALEPLLRRLGNNPEASSALMAAADSHIVKLYQCILEFQLKSVLRFYKGRARRYAGDAIQTEDWAKMLRNIKEFEGTVDKTLMQINQFAARQELELFNVKSTLSLEAMRQLLFVSEEQVRVATEQLGIAQRSLQIQEDRIKQKLSKEQNECLQLFRLTDSSKDATYEWYKDRVEPRVDGTCEWFLKHQNFQMWLEQDSGPLLVSADPGCGKSVLAKFLIDSVLPPSSTICYFFFKDQDQNTCRQALCAVLHQLLVAKPRLIEHAMKQFKRDGRGLVNSTSSLWSILRNAVQDPEAGPIILVLDALDECTEPELETLITNIDKQFGGDQSSHGKLRYLLTSRPYEQIMSKFWHFLDRFPYVRIPGEEESETISQEVNQVIKYRVENLARVKNLSGSAKGHLEERLLGIPHRTYLWVYLVFDYLEKEGFRKTPKGVDATIATLPKSVYEAYEKILSKSKGDGAILKKALSIIIAAVRPLSITEMNVALSIDDTLKSVSDIDLEEEEDFKSRLRALCGLFVSIYDGKVYFLHQTAREFLMREKPATKKSATAIPLEGFWQNLIAFPDAHRVLAETCVKFLNLDSDDIFLDSLYYGAMGPVQHHITFTFFTYSAENWNAHFIEACFNDEASIIPMAFRICDPRWENCHLWFHHYWACRWTNHSPSPLTSLMAASYCGNHILVRLLMQKGVTDLEVEDWRRRRTPLLWAMLNDHYPVVQVLLEYGANTETEDAHHNTPLLLACRGGDETMAKLLLEKESINVDFAESSQGMTGLCGAAARGHAGIVKLLLDRGANINYKTKMLTDTPLSLAAEFGDEKVVQLLIDRGADMEVQLSLYSWMTTALSLAARADHTPVVRVLINAGANMENISPYGYSRWRTPLSWAAEEGHIDVVRLLLDKGADTESRGTKFHPTPLLWAVQSGHIDTVRLLLDKGADIESRARGDRTPLLEAATSGRLDIVRLLLDHGADVGFQSGDGETAMSLALENGHTDVHELLTRHNEEAMSQRSRRDNSAANAYDTDQQGPEVVLVE